jgi:hypothetical protein
MFEEALAAVRDEEDRVALQIGLVATLYFEKGYQPAVRAAVAECFADYLAAFQGQLRWGMHPRSFAWQELARRPVPTPAEWFAKKELRDDDTWAFSYHGGQDDCDANAIRVHGYGGRKWEEERHGWLSYISAGLPLTYLEDRRHELLELLRSWSERLSPVSGYGGLGILESPDHELAQKYHQYVFMLARRFPGLELDRPSYHRMSLAAGIKGVNWLTVLGERWLEKLGGLGSLERHLESDAFTLLEFSGGVVIQAGGEPELGDVNRRLKPERYRALGRVTQPLLVRELHGLRGFDAESAREWLARFVED